MAGIKLEGFQGLIPRTSERLLPNMAASIARNTKLLNGEIRGYRNLVELANLTGQTTELRRAFRVPDTPNDAYIAFDSRDVDVVRSPLVNDAHDRYFWAGDGRPKMNTAARIKNSDPEFFLGIPTPAGAPAVAPPAGSDFTRAYVYTMVSEYGEEGPPSPPTLATGNAGTWELTAMDTTVPDAANRNITNKKIYRTVPGNVSTSFFFVAEITLAASTYSDAETDLTVAANSLLESITFIEPPTTMEGFVVMPNGYLVGWAGRRILMSEPYRPHAWPAEFELSTEFDIVGMAVFGATLVICTESQPYYGQGVNPRSFTTQKIDAVEGCLSRRGIVSTTVGVLYPSINGLVLASGSGVSVITHQLFTKEEWALKLPDQLYAAQLGLQYIAFSSQSVGFMFDPTNPTARLVDLDNYVNVEGIETDRYTGNINLLQNDRVMDWDPEITERQQWRWVSKMYQTPKPLNFGAARLMFDAAVQDTSGSAEDFAAYDSALFTAIDALPGVGKRLNTLGGGVLGGQPAKPKTGLVPTWTTPETRQPLGGSLLYDVADLQAVQSSVRMIIRIADDEVVFDAQITDQNIFRLPTGFKSDLWKFELIGNTRVYSLQVAETPNQLAIV